MPATDPAKTTLDNNQWCNHLKGCQVSHFLLMECKTFLWKRTHDINGLEAIRMFVVFVCLNNNANRLEAIRMFVAFVCLSNNANELEAIRMFVVFVCLSNNANELEAIRMFVVFVCLSNNANEKRLSKESLKLSF